MFAQQKKIWLFNLRGDLLSGLVVALALVPEAIAFSIIAGVDPKIGLYSSFIIPIIIAFTGGRPGMISAATGAMALLMVSLVKDHGLQYLLAASILTGILQILAGYLKLGNLMRFVSRSIVTGFVNALAILIFMAQLPELTHTTWQMYAMTAAGLAIIYLFPYVPIIGKLLPSPLVCIVSLTIVTLLLGLDIRNVGDMGQLPDTLPIFMFPDIPWNLETLWIIFPYSVGLAAVGLLESMMTATIVDDLTNTPSDKNRECRGQGIANIGAAFFGGMAGCAMIGQSMINVKSGGLGRLSALAAGVFLFILVMFLSEWLSLIPMAALVAVMIMVSIGTFSWRSVIDLKKHPLSTNIVMISTVAVVVFTHNLAIGVLCGVLLASLFFANKIAKFMHIKKTHDEITGTTQFNVTGQVFFASANRFIESFEYEPPSQTVKINLSNAHFWDITAVGSLDKVIAKFKKSGAQVEIIGMNHATMTLYDRFGQAELVTEDILISKDK